MCVAATPRPWGGSRCGLIAVAAAFRPAGTVPLKVDTTYVGLKPETSGCNGERAAAEVQSGEVNMRARTVHGLALAMVTAAMMATIADPSAAGSLPQGTRENPLTSITGLRCRFSITTSVLWKDGKPEVHTEATDTRLTFSAVDIQDGTAEIGAGQGRRFATTVLSDGTLFLMESTRGSLDVTTVFATESSPGKLKAVRAHHEYVFLTVPPFVVDPAVSQSYGECEPTTGA
jgi:hypothetical protein